MKTLKKLFLLSFFLMAAFNIGNAQTKKLNIGLGFGTPLIVPEFPSANWDPSDIYPGINFYANLLYNFNLGLSAGFEFNIVLPSDAIGNGYYYGLTYASGYLAKIKYTFGGEGVRMYFAFLTGVYGFKHQSYNYYTGNSYEYKSYQSRFGFATQFGVRISTFQINTSFHFPLSNNNSNNNQNYYYYDPPFLVLQFGIGWNIGVVKND